MPVDSEPKHAAARVGRTRRWLLAAAVLAALAVVAVWLIRVNQISTVVTVGGEEVRQIDAFDHELSEVVIAIDPARRAEGATVELDGRPIAHPAGANPGELIVDLSGLGPGEHDLEIRAPRPSWWDMVTTVRVIVPE